MLSSKDFLLYFVTENDTSILLVVANKLIISYYCHFNYSSCTPLMCIWRVCFDPITRICSRSCPPVDSAGFYRYIVFNKTAVLKQHYKQPKTLIYQNV